MKSEGFPTAYLVLRAILFSAILCLPHIIDLLTNGVFSPTLLDDPNGGFYLLRPIELGILLDFILAIASYLALVFLFSSCSMQRSTSEIAATAVVGLPALFSLYSLVP